MDDLKTSRKADALLHTLYVNLRSFAAARENAIEPQAPLVEATQQLYRSTIELCVNELGGCAGCILFVDPEPDAADGGASKHRDFEHIYDYGYGDAFVWWLKLKSGDGAVSRAISDGRVLVVRDVALDEDYIELCPLTKAQVSIPVIGRSGGVRGAIIVEFARPLDDDEAMFLERLSDRLSRYVVQIEEFLFSLRSQFVLEGIARISEASSESEAIGIIFDTIEGIVGRGEIAILQRNGGKLGVTRFRNIDRSKIPDDLYVGISDGQGYTCAAAHARTTFYCKNTSDRVAYPYYRSVVEDTLSQFTLPLVFRKDLVGVLNVGARHPYAFSFADRKLITSLARHAAHSLYYQRMSGDFTALSRAAGQRLEAFNSRKDRAFKVVKEKEAGALETMLNDGAEYVRMVGYEFRTLKPDTLDIRVELEAGLLSTLRQHAEEYSIRIVTKWEVDGPAVIQMPRMHFEDAIRAVVSAVLLETAGRNATRSSSRCGRCR
jgi:putative methionine-R-sulfoxide reductase with GAF domain